MAYRWDRSISPAQCERDIVPIGGPLPGMKALVVDDQLAPVIDGQDGELLMAGPQVSLGYLQDPDRTRSAFVVPPGQREIFYRTGDRVRRTEGARIVFL